MFSFGRYRIFYIIDKKSVVEEKIESFEKKLKTSKPWIFND